MTPAIADPERWRQLEDLFHIVSDMEPTERTSFLERACAGDAELRREVESLLASVDKPLLILQQPVFEAAREISSGGTLSGQQIGSYQILETIGEGGMGKVYLASRADKTYRQRVAIKVMRAGFGREREMLRRFRTERQILANLTHPNIARLLDGGVTHEGLPYLVMEYVCGIPIDEYCSRNRLNVEARLKLFENVCAALEYAHRNLVIHRDIKPGNILVTEDGVPKLLDFGIAKLLDPNLVDTATPLPTRSAEHSLTPEYASPEQIRGSLVTTASDVYAAGVLMYELLAGVRPFRAKRPIDVARMVCEQNPERPSRAAAVHPEWAPSDANKIKGELDCIVFRAMDKEPERRYASIAALSSDLRAYFSGYPIQARASNWSYRAEKYLGRHKTSMAIAAIVIIALIWFSIAMGRMARRADRERLIAQHAAKFLAGMFEAAPPNEARGDGITARTLLDRGARRIEEDLSAEPELRASLLGTLAEAYRNFGFFDQAQTLAQRSYDLAVKISGATSTEVEKSQELLAEVFRDKGEYSQAVPLLQKVIDTRRKTLRENDPKIAQALGELGECLYWEANDDQAIRILRQAVAMDERNGPDYGADDRNYLALALERRGDFNKARELLQQAVAIDARVNGTSSPSYARSLSNLGSAFIDRGDLSAAETKLRESLIIRRKVLGAGHPDLMYSLNNLGYVLLEKGDGRAAEPFVREALDINLQRLGPNHPRVVPTMNNWARVLQAKGDYAGAEKTYKRALAIIGRPGAASTWPQAQVIANLGVLYFDEAEYTKAEGFARRALQLRRQLGGENTPAYASSLIELAEDWVFEGHPSDAEPLLRQALRIRREKLWPGHPAIITAQVRLGEELLAEQKAAEAQQLLSEAVTFARNSLFPLPAWQIAEVESAYGACLDRLGDTRRGDALLRQSRTALALDPRPVFRTHAFDLARSLSK